MAKASIQGEDGAVAVAAEPSEFPVGVAEFCTIESKTDRRVEILAAFSKAEKRAGRLTDTPTNYRARLKGFAGGKL